VLARTWLVLEDPDDLGVETAAAVILHIIAFFAEHPGSLDEIIEGSRGGTSSLPSLIVASMRRALKYTSNAKVFGPLIHVLSLFIDQIRHDLPGNTLLDHGVLKLMVEQWCVLRNVPVGIVDPSRSLSIGILKLLDTPPGYPWIAEALTAGLLRGIILHARNANIIEDLKGLIGVVLSRSTVYYSVLSVLGSSLFAVADEMKSEHFLGSELIGEWGKFVQLVTERLEVVKMYDSDTYFSSQGCDYTKVRLSGYHTLPPLISYLTQCCVIGEKRRFKCCSACQKVYYCSSACQKKDWRNGGHRNRCEGIRTFRPGTSNKFVHKSGAQPKVSQRILTTSASETCHSSVHWFTTTTRRIEKKSSATE
jgi:hypothetical protein